MGKSAEVYIENRIEQSRTTDPGINADIARSDGKSTIDAARDAAKKGWTIATASNLFHSDTLSVGQKGDILATAYAKDAENTTKWAAGYRGDPDFKKELIMRAQRLKLTAQGLTRAAKRA